MTLLERCIVDGEVRLPMGRPANVRAELVPSWVWLGYATEDVMRLSLTWEKLFPLVWGSGPGFDGKPERFFVREADGSLVVDEQAPGYLIARRRVWAMREAWAGFWWGRLRVTLRMEDSLVFRFFNGQALRIWQERVVAAGYQVEWEVGVDGQPVMVPALGKTMGLLRQQCGKAEANRFGVEARAEFERWLSQDVLGRGESEAVTWLVGALSRWHAGLRLGAVPLTTVQVRKEGAVDAVLLSDLEVYREGVVSEPVSAEGVEGGVGVRPEGELFATGPVLSRECRSRFRWHLRRYVEEQLGKGILGGQGRKVEWVGGGKLVRYGSAGEVVDVPAMSGTRFRGMPSGLVAACSSWWKKALAAFDALGRLRSPQEAGSMPSGSRELMELLGFSFEGGVVVELKSGWASEVAEEILVEAGLASVADQYKGRVGGLVEEWVETLMGHAGLRQSFALYVVADDELGGRPAIVGGGSKYWDQVELVADHRLSRALARRVGDEPPADPRFDAVSWGPVAERRGFYDRWYREIFCEHVGGYEGQMKYWLPTMAYRSWFQGQNDQWARGVVCLEGAMRAYLRRAGFGLVGEVIGDEEAGTIGKFWREVGVRGGVNDVMDWSRVPDWRWELLREAYLASLVWGWAEFLYGGWAPFDGGWIWRFGRALPMYSALVGAYTRGRSDVVAKECVPVWNGERLRVAPGASMASSVVGMLNFDTSWFSAGWVAVEKAKEEAKQSGQPLGDVTALRKMLGMSFGGSVFGVGELGGERLPVAGAPVVVPRRTGAPEPKNGVFVRVGDRWEVAKGGTLLLGVEGMDMGRAVQMVGNWFLAGHSRYGALQVGAKFRAWLEGRGMDPGLSRIWGQFGLLPTSEWRQSPGLAPLFGGVTPDENCYSFCMDGGFPAAGKFDAWRKLGGSLLTTWSLVEQAPLSFPFVPLSYMMSGSLAAMVPVFWLDRTLRALGRGLDPVGLRPLAEVKPGLKGAEADSWMEWRSAIWRPLLSGSVGGMAARVWEEPERWDWAGRLSPEAGKLWRTWARPWAMGRPAKR